jgi:hypothetical protein
MSLTLTLDVIISLIFTWLLSALLVGAVNEVIAGFLNVRGAYLTQAIELLTTLGGTDASRWNWSRVWLDGIRRTAPGDPRNPTDKAAVDAFRKAIDASGKPGATARTVADAIKTVEGYDKLGLADKIDAAAEANGATPAGVLAVLRPVYGLANLQNHALLVRTPHGLPSYVPSRDFSTALVSVLAEGAGNSDAAFAQAKGVINDLPDGTLKTVLLSFIDAGADDLATLKARIENWYDDAMQRVGGLYKRFAQYSLLVLGLLLAMGMNIDSIHVARTLWEQPTLAKAIADQAEGYATNCRAPGDKLKDDPACLPRNVEAVRDLVDRQTLPIGRQPGDSFFGENPLFAIGGWIITAFAISLGAQFWFDLLNKFVNIRAAGQKPERADAQEAQ